MTEWLTLSLSSCYFTFLQLNSACHFISFCLASSYIKWFFCYCSYFPHQELNLCTLHCKHGVFTGLPEKSHHSFLCCIISITCWFMEPSGQLPTNRRKGIPGACLWAIAYTFAFGQFFGQTLTWLNFSRFSSLLLLKLFNFLLHLFLFGSDGLDHWHGIAQLFLKNKNWYVFNLVYEVKVYNIIFSTQKTFNTY